VIVADGTSESAASMMVSTAGSSLLMPAPSTWSVRESMASSKPPATAGVDPVAHGKKLRTTDIGDPTMVVDGISAVASEACRG
jgi:hypothetical protein